MQHTQQLQQANEDQINALCDNHTAWINKIGLDYTQKLANIAQAHADALTDLHDELTHQEKMHGRQLTQQDLTHEQQVAQQDQKDEQQLTQQEQVHGQRIDKMNKKMAQREQAYIEQMGEIASHVDGLVQSQLENSLQDCQQA
jgi:hypothetical protein